MSERRYSEEAVEAIETQASLGVAHVEDVADLIRWHREERDEVLEVGAELRRALQERDAERTEVSKLRQKVDHATARLTELERERDEARAELRKWQEEHSP